MDAPQERPRPPETTDVSWVFTAAEAQVMATLHESLVREAAAAVDEPHVVVCRSLLTDELSLLGPFASVVTALRVVEAETEAELESTAGRPQLVFDVARLYRPDERDV